MDCKPKFANQQLVIFRGGLDRIVAGKVNGSAPMSVREQSTWELFGAFRLNKTTTGLTTKGRGEVCNFRFPAPRKIIIQGAVQGLAEVD